MIQRSVVNGALQQPTTRHFLDQCVSFLDLLDVMAIRGGGSSSSSTSGNDPYDDWSNINNNNNNKNSNQYNYQNQYDDRNTDDDDYNTTPSPPQRRSRARKDGIGSSFSSLPNVLQKVDRKTGLMLLVSGISLTFLGITLFFNKTIIRLGHLLCIAGILLSMGLSQTIQYFVQPEKLRATICLGFGVFLVFIGSPLFGIALEVFGILNLFGNMFPIVMVMIKQMPIIGTMLKSTTNNNSNNNRSRRNSNDDDYYYSNDSRRQSQQPSSRNQYDYDNRDEYAREEDDGLGRRY
jgi:Got1/Sft2-like family